MAWSGSFRIHELCSRGAKEFDSQTTLLWKDVALGELKVGQTLVKSVSIHVKSPKVDRVGAGDNVEVFQLGNFMCPIAALAKYREESRLQEESELPVFRLDSGLCWTGTEMNRRLVVLILKALCQGVWSGPIASEVVYLQRWPGQGWILNLSKQWAGGRVMLTKHM